MTHPGAALVIAHESLPEALQEQAQAARALMRSRHAESTRRAYASDLKDFQSWAQAHGVVALPASAASVVLYLAHLASAGRKPATIGRKVAAIRYLHREAGYANPCDSEAVTAAMAGIRRTLGAAPRQAAPATADLVSAMLATCDTGDLVGIRDRALLALGFSGALRRSELVALRLSDMEETPEGYRIHIRRSKTDKSGAGQVVPVIDGPRLMLRASLGAWIAAAGVKDGPQDGPLFRRLARYGRVTPDALSGRSVADIVKARALAAGLDPALYSGHSLRSGFLTSGAQAGASLFKLLEVSRHRKVETLQGYIRSANHFKDHAGSAFA